MAFIWYQMLWTLLAIPLLVLLYLRMQERRKKLTLRYGSLGLVQQAAGKGIGARRHIPAVLFLVGLIVLFLALARPQMVVGLPRVEGIVILAFDVSGSMAAEDFAPNRLEAAKVVASEFVSRQPSTVQVGIVAFSDSGFSVQLPTDDQAEILDAISRLRPQRGTSVANGIVVSLNTIATAIGMEPVVSFDENELPNLEDIEPTMIVDDNSAVIVLLTDGENNMDPDPLAAAEFAAEQGVRIHTIAIGSAEGTVLEVNGFSVFTQVDEASLRQIAEITDGLYFNAQNEEDLREVYESIEPRLLFKQEETEVTSIFAGVSILILLVGGMLSLLWFSRVP
ncbi:MAG: VWA domain-containing protein [Anaerolineales bacterium]|nr:MAG: VWA domain-containing protein [Anaerolineales bacterium]